MLRAIVLCSLAASPLLGDVVPRCGGPTVSEQSPGEWCGHHGPQRRGDCRPPGACYIVDSGGPTCTSECAADDECVALGPGFVCSAHGKPYAVEGSPADRRLCRRRSP
jgi:hypothetical protein